MPGIVAKEFNGGHDFKTSHVAGFERKFHKFKAVLYLWFLFCPFLQSCVQMDADTNNHSEEGIALSGMDAHIMEMVII